MSRSPEHVEYAEILLRRATGDLRVCQALADDPDIDDNAVGFHAQQAVEKSLKVALVLEVRPHGEGSPSERFRREVDEALAGVTSDVDPRRSAGWGTRLILQQALEDEVSEFLGRRRYERAEKTVNHRNGYEPRTV